MRDYNVFKLYAKSEAAGKWRVTDKSFLNLMKVESVEKDLLQEMFEAGHILTTDPEKIYMNARLQVCDYQSNRPMYLLEPAK